MFYIMSYHITSLATALLIRNTGAPQYTTNIRPILKHAAIKRKCDKTKIHSQRKIHNKT